MKWLRSSRRPPTSMACLVSLCSFTDFTTRKTLIKDLQARRTDNCRLLLSSSTCLTGIQFLAPKFCGEELVSMKRCHNPAAAVFLDYKDVYTPRVMSGFWVGPDTEDGWGFVEATVDQIFEGLAGLYIRGVCLRFLEDFIPVV